jgi:hypothetical protein
VRAPAPSRDVSSSMTTMPNANAPVFDPPTRPSVRVLAGQCRGACR